MSLPGLDIDETSNTAEKWHQTLEVSQENKLHF